MALDYQVCGIEIPRHTQNQDMVVHSIHQSKHGSQLSLLQRRRPTARLPLGAINIQCQILGPR